jgi:hypothetical protein
MIRVGVEPFLECSSKGDKRFSAFYARLLCERNRSIEELYQGFKVFDNGQGGTVSRLNVKDAKGKLALNQEEAKKYYSWLWDIYFQENPDLLHVIKQYGGFSDIFGQVGRCCQAIEVFRIQQRL